MFRVGIPPPQPLVQEDIIIIINTERNQTINYRENKRGCGGVVPTLNMFMIFMNRKTLNEYKQTETKKNPMDSLFKAVAAP